MPAPPEPDLRGPQVRVALAQPRDIPAIIAFFRDHAVHLRRFTPVAGQKLTVAFWEGEIQQRIADYAAGVSLNTFLYRADDASRVIGTANLHPIIRGPFQAAYLGYSIAPDQEGRGIMHEALRLLTAFAFDSLQLHRIMANHMPSNVRSEKLLARLGFVKEGYARGYLQINGVWEDHVLTALVKNEATP